jgi:hypothetical protein
VGHLAPNGSQGAEDMMAKSVFGSLASRQLREINLPGSATGMAQRLPTY